MNCRCGYADECDDEHATFYPLQEGGMCAVVKCNSPIIQEPEVIREPCPPPKPRFALVPMEVIKAMAEIDTYYIEYHEDNGPGYTACGACGAIAPMKWTNGYRLDTHSDIKHDKHCPVVWAKEFLSEQ